MNLIDDFLNGITMYRLLFYFLLILVAWAAGLAFFGLVPFNPLTLLASVTFLMLVGWVTNTIFAKTFKAVTNLESIYITTLILSLIITLSLDLHHLIFMFWVAVWASASKFIFAIKKKAIFNPAAIGVYLTGLGIVGSASWWVGTAWMMPAVLIGGFLIVKKIKRFELFFTFMAVALVTIIGLTAINGNVDLSIINKIFLDSPILFFGMIMLTEPLTTPPNRSLRFVYGALVGFLYAPQFHLGSFNTTPELALVIGNIFSYLVSPKERLLLKLKQKIQLSPDTFDFVFGLDAPIKYTAGQFMEWTLSQKNPDTRGSRRYFTLASSPTEDSLRIGVKFYPNGSSWKKTLMEMPIGGELVAAQVAGEFTLPKDPIKKLVFVAGGIGVTPYRSIIKYLMDKKELRDIVLIYSVKADVDAVYMDLFNQAASSIGLRNIVNVSDRTGMVTGEMIARDIPDFKERTFYLSGPHGMVDGFEKTLGGLGVPGGQIKTDYFPGYA